MKTKVIKKSLFLLLLQISFLSFAQEFSKFNNLEQLFKLSKNKVEEIITKEYGYLLKSRDLKLGSVTYIKRNPPYNFTVSVIFKANQLNYISWNDRIIGGKFIVDDIGNDVTYKIDEVATNDYLGVFSAKSFEKGLQVNIFRTRPNLEQGIIAFSIMRIGKPLNAQKNGTSKESAINKSSSSVGNTTNFPIYTYDKLIDNTYYEENGSILSEQFKEYYFLYGVVKKVIKKGGYSEYEIHITKTTKEFDNLHDNQSFENNNIILSLDPDDLYNKNGQIKKGWQGRYNLNFEEYKKLKSLLVEGTKIKFSYLEGGAGTLGTASAGLFYFNYIEQFD